MVIKMQNIKITVNSVFLIFVISVNRDVTILFLCKGYWYLIRMNEKKEGVGTHTR